MKKRKLLLLALAAMMILSLFGCKKKPIEPVIVPEPVPNQQEIVENGIYDELDKVVAYHQQFGHLPNNYITKTEARKLGWSSGSVEKFAEGKTIGGDEFQNREGLLPKKDGRQYYECDIATLGASSRGSKRLVYSNDGLYYYTEDSFKSFRLVAGEEDIVVPQPDPQPDPPVNPGDEITVEQGKYYYDKEHVALYIHTFGTLPDNYMTKTEARKLGWSGGGLEKYAAGRVIGGDVFSNREGVLPKKNGRTYYECDIDTYKTKSRGAKRIVFSSDGLVYYTEDHYETFELLYGEE